MIIFFVGLLPLISGHGLMNWPPTRAQNNIKTGGLCEGLDKTVVPQNGTCLWFNQGCTIGCAKCTGGTKGCSNEMNPTNNDINYLTYPHTPAYQTRKNPWRAPGFAPVESPCGLAGGWYTPGAPGNGGFPPTGIKQGFDGRKMPVVDPKYEWKSGSNQEVSWSIHANHGGGYAYRLCPTSGDMTEECFMNHHLDFVGEYQWIQYSDDKNNRTRIPAVQLSVGTNPKGSQWRRNPIPACVDPAGGALHNNCTAPQFNPPIPGLYGFGLGTCKSGLPGKDCTDAELEYWTKKFNFNIIDLIIVPSNIPKGDYVLSFRWDSEQTPQIWAVCSDITIT